VEASGGDGERGADGLESQRYCPLSAHSYHHHLPKHTASSVPYDRVQRGYEVGHNGVGIVQAG